MHEERIPALPGAFNLNNYESTYDTFSFAEVEKSFSWFETGKMNMAYECLDRHKLTHRHDKIALLYSDFTREERYTFAQLSDLTNRFGNVLRSLGVQKGDRIFVFLPRTPELYVTLLGAIKVGAIVGPLFEAFMTTAIKDRLVDSGAKILVTTSDLLSRVPLPELPDLESVIIVGDAVYPETGVSFYAYEEEMQKQSNECEIEWMDREDGLILHYTSGSTGKPKGVLHVHNAMIQHYQTGDWVLDLKEEDVYWCTADPGWVTGASYGIFAPWLNGATNVVRGTRFSPHDWYSTIERYKVTVWYSAPTAFRMLMSAGDDIVGQYDLSSLRHILSVGEALNAEVIRWGMHVYGKRIHDNWWMTETGAQLIANYPCMDIKPGSMGKPLPGIVASIVDDQGNELPANQMGNLVIRRGWPAMMHKIWNNDAKFQEYFQFEGWYLSGDSAFKDAEGYFWFQGRVDDVINTSGERVGPFEVESKLVEHPAVAEAGVIGIPDPIRGEIIKAFIALREGYMQSDELLEDIRLFVRHGLSAHAMPREIECREKLPKTRSGKIMRRVLKAWELQLPAGDLSTMED